MKMQRFATRLPVLVLAAAGLAHAQGVVTTVNAPYEIPGPGAPAAPRDQVVALPVAQAERPRPLLTFALLAEDRTVRNAFLRWGEQAKSQVVWQVDGDIPLDATGTVLGQSLADAMTKVAASFSDKKLPFVIREYDNAIVVLPKWAVRQ